MKRDEKELTKKREQLERQRAAYQDKCDELAGEIRDLDERVRTLRGEADRAHTERGHSLVLKEIGEATGADVEARRAAAEAAEEAARSAEQSLTAKRGGLDLMRGRLGEADEDLRAVERDLATLRHAEAAGALEEHLMEAARLCARLYAPAATLGKARHVREWAPQLVGMIRQIRRDQGRTSSPGDIADELTAALDGFDDPYFFIS